MEIPQEVEELRKDLIWARHYLNQYKKLILSGQKRIDKLNEVAPRFFRDLQMIYWDEMIICVAKLMDPHVQGSHKNLSLNILSKLAQENQWAFQNEIDILVDEIIQKAKPIIKRRMKLTAHRDLPTAMGKAVLEDVKIDEIDDVLTLAGEALNIIYLKLKDTTWSWDLISGHDAGELVHYLKYAIIYKDLIEDEQDWVKKSELWQNSRYYNA